jgi:ComF family protein
VNIIEQFLNVIAPHACVGCGCEGYLLCEDCTNSLTPIPPRCYNCQRAHPQARTCAACRAHSSLYSVWAVTPYGGPAQILLHRLKFERAQAAARDVARAMAARLQLPAGVLVTYVPTAPSRVRQRGYDQAALIAKELARQLNLPYAPLLARRTALRQVGQTREVRKTQMRQAFRVARRSILQNKHILLIDDVITTGATCEAAAAALKAAGARRVSAAVFAAA